MPAFHSSHADAFDFSENDYSSPLDLNRHLVPHPAATYFLRLDGDSLRQDGILRGDTLIVDRTLQPVSGSLVVAELNGELLARRLQLSSGRTSLLCSDGNGTARMVSARDNFSVWGVIIASFRKY
ncbi:MAG: LexA family transcriptional regulator [Alphaproteobacteria bacterium]|nr:LexA family transcriptional regulator [Alphaproteobacteria bacterium]